MKQAYKKYLFRHWIFYYLSLAALILCLYQTGLADPSTEPSILNYQFLKGPYLIYDGNNSQMKVMWQLNDTADCIIHWGPDTSYSSGSATTKEYNKDHQHSYSVVKLKPGTKYYYKVIAGNDENPGSFFTAPGNDENKIKFFVYGDTRSFPYIHNEIAGSIISDYTNDPKLQTLVLFVGDMVTFGAEESSWNNETFGLANSNIREMMASLPILSCAGNHELYLADYKNVDKNLTLFKKYFSYPFIKDTYWSFNYGPAHFVILDQFSQNLETKELEWCKKDLESTNKPWKFVCLHEPGWSAGGDEMHQNNETVQKLFQPVFEKHQVTAVFAGHNHYYARALVNGVYHITTGGGGAPLLEPEPYSPHVITTSKTYHYCKAEINKDTFIFQALKPDGTIIDTFTLKVTEK